MAMFHNVTEDLLKKSDAVQGINECVIEVADSENCPPVDGTDGRYHKKSFWSRLMPNRSEPNREENFASKKTAAEGMMDIALLTANANQLRFLFTYNYESKTYYLSVGLIIISLVLQVLVGIVLIFKRQMKNKGQRANWTNNFLVTGVFLVTVINVLVASFTTTHGPEHHAIIPK